MDSCQYRQQNVTDFTALTEFNDVARFQDPLRRAR